MVGALGFLISKSASNDGLRCEKVGINKWAKVAGEPLPVVTQRPNKPIRVIDLPGVRALEGRLLLSGRDRGRSEDMVASVARDLFGVGHFELQFTIPEKYRDLPSYAVSELHELEQLREVHESQFETSDRLTDDETVEVMARLGFDFRDDAGRSLRCTKLMNRPVEAAAKGIMGHLPDRGAIELKKFEADLEKARDAFLAKKRRR